MLSVISIGLLLLALAPRVAHATNGQCIWEGGPGAPSYPGCLIEDCAEHGGLAQCSKPITAPPIPYIAAQVGAESWVYYSCSGYTDNPLWCAAAGGTYNGFNCIGAHPAVLGSGGATSNDESFSLSTSAAYATLKFGTCGAALTGDSGWGTSTEAGSCYSNAVPPSYRNGMPIDDYRKRSFTPGAPCNGLLNVWIHRKRQLACPVGHTVRNRPDGNLDCVLPAEACCTRKGNPVSIVTGAKFQREVDYAGSPGVPEFQRWYSSAGMFRPLGSGDGPVSSTDFWRHSFDRRLYPIAGNAHLRGTALRPDGTVMHFDGSGRELLNRDGAGARLQSDGSAGWTLTLSHGEEERYTASGRLTSITTRAGAVTSVGYDGAGRVSTVLGPYGHALTFSYNGDGLLQSLLLPDGSTIGYSYDASKRLTAVAYPGVASRVYAYEHAAWPWLLTGIEDESGQRFARYTYDSAGRATASEHAGGAQRFTFSYGTYGTTVTYPSGFVGGFPLINSAGVRRIFSNPLSCPDCGGVKSVAYDVNGNPSQQTTGSGKTNYAFDATRNLEVSRTEGLNNFGNATARTRTTLTAWHPTQRLPTSLVVYSGTSGTGTALSTTGFTYDDRGNVLTRTVSDAVTGTTRTWSYTYNGFGQVLSEDGPRTDVSDVTTYSYYSCTTGYQCGQLQAVTNAFDQTMTYNTYNAHGQPLSLTDANGVVSTISYDARQRLTARCVNGSLPGCAGGELTALEYWPTGRMKKVTLPDGSYLSYAYDAAQRLTEIADAEGNRLVYTLDAAGNRTTESSYDLSNALVRSGFRVYNALNQLHKEITAANTPTVTTTYGYDANGNATSVAAPLGRTTGQAYDELDRLKEITDPGGGVTRLGYDAQDHLTAVTDPRGLVTSYQYNGLGDLNQLSSPDTGVTTSTYDSAGNLATRTDARGKVGTYGYDRLNRLTSIAHADRTVAFSYDSGTHGTGRLTGAGDATHSLSWSYDALGRPSGRTQVVAGKTRTVGYAYSNGNLASLTTPSGQLISYSYDTAGRISAISINGTVLLSQVLYDPFGPARSWSWGNGTLTNRSYDGDGSLTGYDSAGYVSYGHDDALRVTSRTDSAPGGQSWSYGYDSLDRLTTATRPGLSRGWTYDANGNRLSQTGTNVATYNNAAGSNRITSVTGTPARTYSYDGAGNVTSYATVTLAYQDDGRLKQATKGSTTRSYLYNALGQRVSKKNGSSHTFYVYDDDGRLLGEYSNALVLIQETVWFGDIPVATLRPKSGGGVNIFYVHADHLNTPRKITSASDNALRWRWDPDPFGTNQPNGNPAGLGAFTYNLRFPGQYYDSETGLHYNYFRDYDPAVGRYVQSDPIGLEGGINTYAYALGNPVALTDPFGLWVKRCSRTLDSSRRPLNRESLLYRQNLRHDYLSISGNTVGFYPQGNSVVGPGVVQPGGERPDGEGCFTICGDDAFDNYVRAAADKVGTPTYCALAVESSVYAAVGSRNCQTWVDDVLKEAKQQYLQRESCPTCFR